MADDEDLKAKAAMYGIGGTLTIGGVVALNSALEDSRSKVAIIEQHETCFKTENIYYPQALNGLPVSDLQNPEKIRKALKDEKLTSYKICTATTGKDGKKALEVKEYHLNASDELKEGAERIQAVREARAKEKIENLRK